MIRIQCSLLEQARKNPTMYGQMLASSLNTNRGGSHGMFAYWQDIALKIHKDEFDVNKGIKELQQAFLNFNETPQNLQKQDFLQACFIKYHEQLIRKS